MSKQNKKIIIISLQGIGNNIFVNPLIKKLRELFPDYQIDIIIRSKILKEIFNYDKYINNIFILPIKLKNIFKSFYTLLKLRKSRYDYSITVFPANHIFFNIIAYIIGAKKRITHNYKKLYIKTARFLQNVYIPLDLNAHDIKQNLNLLRYFKYIPKKNDIKYEIYIDKIYLNRAKEFLHNKGIEKNDLVIGIHAGSSKAREMKHKRWDEYNFVQLIIKLYEKFHTKIILFAGPDDRQLTDSIYNEAKNNIPSKNIIIAQLNLGTIAAVIKRCNLMISNDSGLMNIAAALGVRLVVIQGGPTDPIRTSPLGKQHIVLNPPIECYPCRTIENIGLKFKCPKKINCVNLITLEMVLDKIKI